LHCAVRSLLGGGAARTSPASRPPSAPSRISASRSPTGRLRRRAESVRRGPRLAAFGDEPNQCVAVPDVTISRHAPVRSEGAEPRLPFGVVFVRKLGRRSPRLPQPSRSRQHARRGLRIPAPIRGSSPPQPDADRYRALLADTCSWRRPSAALTQGSCVHGRLGPRAAVCRSHSSCLWRGEPGRSERRRLAPRQLRSLGADRALQKCSSVRLLTRA
jgi:hypothetical protein